MCTTIVLYTIPWDPGIPEWDPGIVYSRRGLSWRFDGTKKKTKVGFFTIVHANSIINNIIINYNKEDYSRLSLLVAFGLINCTLQCHIAWQKLISTCMPTQLPHVLAIFIRAVIWSIVLQPKKNVTTILHLVSCKARPIYLSDSTIFVWLNIFDHIYICKYIFISPPNHTRVFDIQYDRIRHINIYINIYPRHTQIFHPSSQIQVQNSRSKIIR